MLAGRQAVAHCRDGEQRRVQAGGIRRSGEYGGQPCRAFLSGDTVRRTPPAAARFCPLAGAAAGASVHRLSFSGTQPAAPHGRGGTRRPRPGRGRPQQLATRPARDRRGRPGYRQRQRRRARRPASGHGYPLARGRQRRRRAVGAGGPSTAGGSDVSDPCPPFQRRPHLLPRSAARGQDRVRRHDLSLVPPATPAGTRPGGT